MFSSLAASMASCQIESSSRTQAPQQLWMAFTTQFLRYRYATIGLTQPTTTRPRPPQQGQSIEGSESTPTRASIQPPATPVCVGRICGPRPMTTTNARSMGRPTPTVVACVLALTDLRLRWAPPLRSFGIEIVRIILVFDRYNPGGHPPTPLICRGVATGTRRH